MKTVQDLVDRLNGINHLKPFSIEHYYDKYYLVVEYSIRTKNTVVEFYQPNYRFHEDIACLHSIEQNIIVDYLANSNPKDWFPKKRYNIVIGIDTNTDFKTAYRKTATKGVYEVNGSTELNDLRKNRYIFTDEEIKNLKVTLPPDLSKIVDLGKVEVHD